ncbi:recombinase family protein [Dietzia maris]
MRPALGRVQNERRKGDELVVSEFDRLGRKLRNLLVIADGIRAEGAALTI